MSKMLRLREFVVSALRTIQAHHDDEHAILAALTPALASLVAQDDWLPDKYAQADPQSYRQYLLYGDPLDRLSIVSLVWGPGQKTPIHDHRTWGLVGALRGAEISTAFARTADGRIVAGETTRLEPGMVTTISPAVGDIHAVANAYTDRSSISIHIYGANIARIERTNYDAATGAPTQVRSRYANTDIPNLWAL